MSVEPTTPWPRSVQATICLTPGEVTEILRTALNLGPHAKVSYDVGQAGERPGENYHVLQSVSIETRVEMPGKAFKSEPEPPKRNPVWHD